MSSVAPSLVLPEREAPLQPLSQVVRYVCDLAKKNSEALSFIPTPTLERYAKAGQVMLATENDEPCGFIVHGAGWPQMRIYQACVQYDARRREHGMALVSRLTEKAKASGCSDIRLWCADDLEANAFWRDSGFSQHHQRQGGIRRGRKHNLWSLTLSEPPLLALSRLPQNGSSQ